MKLKYLYFLFTFIALSFFKQSSAQDLRVDTIIGPVSGCMLGFEDVVVIIGNDNSFISKFPVSYQINGGPVVTDTVTINSTFTTYSYTFTIPADLSSPGTYAIDAFTSLVGDPQPANNAAKTVFVTSFPFSVGGSVAANSTVCSGSNNDTLILLGFTGNILNWEYSTDGGFSWNTIANTTFKQGYLNLTTTTDYRAVVKSGTCPSQNSSAATVTVDPVTVGGSVTPNLIVCNTANSGTITLSGHTGSVLNWESSVDGGANWINIPNTTTTHAFTNIPATTQYRAQVKSGVCNSVFSLPATVTVVPPSVGGTISGPGAVCSGTNSDTLILSGYTGNILRWEYSTDGGATWILDPNTTPKFGFSNLTSATQYRALVESCAPPAYSSIATVAVDPTSVGGTTSASATVCSGFNSGIITLSAFTGSILNWESNTTGTWTPIVNTGTNQPYSNLTATTQYRAVVKSGSCSISSSSITVITVDPVSVGGNITGSKNVCIGTNSGLLTLENYSGLILNWEVSTNGGTTWSNIINTNNTYSFLNITTTTRYRAKVKSGVCDSAYSLSAIITVDPLTAGGNLSPVSDTACKFLNSNTIMLSGITGTVMGWELSSDNGITWSPIINTNTSLTYSNLIESTIYRAIVQSGSCPSTFSTVSSVFISPQIFSAGNDTTINTGGSVTLNGSGGSSYIWQPSTGLNNSLIANPVANPTVTTEYILAGIDLNGCSAIDTVLVNVTGDFNFLIPNLLTLNGDGINDTWEIKTIENYPTSEVIIYNIHGMEVYNAKPYLNEWAGKFNGNTLPNGTYYYVLKFKDPEKTFKGSITLLGNK